MARRTVWAFAGLVMAVAALTAHAGPASAADPAAAGIVVDSLTAVTADDGACTLPEAVANANADAQIWTDCAPGSGADTISFTVSGTITLAGWLRADGSLSIDGGGEVTVTTTASQPLVLNVGTLTIRGLTLTGGGGVYGGALVNHGTMRVERCVFTANLESVDGGGIASYDDLTVTDSTFEANSAAVHGGAIAIHAGDAVITGSTFARNTSGVMGGAVWVSGSAVIANSTFAGNSAPTGSAIHLIGAEAALVVENVTITGNGGGSGLDADPASSATVKNALITGNSGGDTSDPATTFDTAVANVIGADGVGQLEPDLADNHGPTHTIRTLETATHVLHQGDLATCWDDHVNGVDQRGAPRSPGACDVGALERMGSVGVRAPTTRVLVGATMSGSRIRVRVTVARLASETQPVDHFDLERSTDGGSWTSLPVAAGVPYVDTTVASGHKYWFRVRAIGWDPVNDMAWIGTDFRPRLIQQTSGSVTWHGAWHTVYRSGYTGGSARSATARGASAKLTFTGHAVAVILSTGNTRGRARIYVDGVYTTTIDLHATTPVVYRYQAYQKTWPTGRHGHTLKVVLLGTGGHQRIDVDAFVVDG